MKNRITEMLHIQYPIIQGGMVNISRSELVASVSNAGGLGTLGHIGDIHAWRDEIRKIRSATDKPFAVNMAMYLTDIKERIKIIIEEGIEVVATAAGNPSVVIHALKGTGIKVMHVVSNSEQAKKVEAAGVDVVIAEGGESGGIVSKDIISTMVLVPRVVDSVSIPVIAAGGIADARGLVACLALGAEGVQLGTAFEASEESCALPEWKEGIVKAREMDTAVVARGTLYARIIKEEICPGGVMTGQVAALVSSVEKAAVIMMRIADSIGTVFNTVEKQIKN